jgi:hypothetical protein
MDELERMKREIPLADVAADYGYLFDKRASCKSSVVMRHPAEASKLVIATDEKSGHGVFFEVHGTARGSVLDFVMWREGLNLGHARRLLRNRLGSSGSVPPRPRFYIPTPIAIDQMHLSANWEAMQPFAPGYLESRGLSQATIEQFASQLRADQRGNTLFRHSCAGLTCGWEIKNVGFTGFCAGGQKALFLKLVGSREMPPATIFVAESAIDVMSYFQIHQQPGLYLSFAGGLSEAQIAQLAALFARYPHASVIIATDNDATGEDYAGVLRRLCADAVRALPLAGKDWNECLTGGSAR